jgi:hypothetical protein
MKEFGWFAMIAGAVILEAVTARAGPSRASPEN